MLIFEISAAIIDSTEAKCIYGQVARAFIYCNYAERSEQSIEQLLGSLVQQLLRQCPMLDEVEQFFNLHKASGKTADATEICIHLNRVIAQFSTVYIVIDALDECENMNKTRTRLLTQMNSLQPHVRIAVTSRPLGDITALDAAQKFEVAAQEADIHKYVVARIAQETHLADLCTRDLQLQRDILDQISNRAGGM